MGVWRFLAREGLTCHGDMVETSNESWRFKNRL